jgi:hypothetical protein
MRKILMAAGLSLAVTALAGASAVAAAGAETDTLDVGPTTVNVCGEPVLFSGTMYSTERVSRDPVGQEHSTGHVRLVASGVGLTSGTRYVLVGGTADTTSWRPAEAPAGTVTTTVFTTRYISASAADDYVMTVVYHVTVTPDGEVIAEFDNVIVDECR